MTNTLDQYIDTLFPELVSWRRYLHQYPELSYHENKTSQWIKDTLESFGCHVKRCDYSNGLIVSIQGELNGPTIALRADIDGLPIQDQKTVPYASKIAGVMHACGHDGHTAALMGIAKYYMEKKHELRGERRLLFQAAEEVAPGGALSLIKSGALVGVDAIYGVHLWTPLAYPNVASRSGAFMSAVDDFKIDIYGQGGHGGMPHATIDSIIVGSMLVQSLQTIVSRNIDPLESAVITIGSIHAGTANNVIAEHCELRGTIRAFDENVRKTIHHKLDGHIRQICELHGATYQLEMKYGYPALVNDSRETARFFKTAESMIDHQYVQEAKSIMIAEDFAYYLKEVPGCFLFVGAGNAERNAVYPHHHAHFDFDERAMKNSMKLLIGLAENYEAE